MYVHAVILVVAECDLRWPNKVFHLLFFFLLPLSIFSWFFACMYVSISVCKWVLKCTYFLIQFFPSYSPLHPVTVTN